ncbi:HNH endonuclease [Idiomarina sp. M1R2S28]|uniref:HNH endonuclease n=1 Tax=Idiomarina rhizosphaerae TaxID=2961572 RepID=A0A9X2FUE2_9GAMM|nr:HNH endonuclease [Idiomarina rhizosphaerae]MCP1339266.1 HNH endonuclease [Idiomarina rhizosphaerae]
MWPQKVKENVLVACGRHCCVCHMFCGRNIELHHILMESKGGDSNFDNCIPLCFNCHAEAGHYNSEHPKGTKYSSKELRKHRDRWYQAVKELEFLESKWKESQNKQIEEVYEDQVVTLKGFVWREAFPGPPNYDSFETDRIETYWMLVLPEPISLFTNSFETEETIKIENIKKLQLCVDSEFYKSNREIVRTNVELTGKLFMSISGHHHGDANFDIRALHA